MSCILCQPSIAWSPALGRARETGRRRRSRAATRRRAPGASAARRARSPRTRDRPMRPIGSPTSTRPDPVAGPREAALVEQAIGRQVHLAMEANQGAVPDESDALQYRCSASPPRTRRRPASPARCADGEQARVIGADRNVGNEVLEQVSGERQLREDGELRPLGLGSADAIHGDLEVRVELAESRRDLGQRDAVPTPRSVVDQRSRSAITRRPATRF